MAHTRRDQIRDTLRQHLISDLHLGVLRPGDRLPSAREVARQLDADYRVVVAAYRDLERDGLVEVRARSGIFVAREEPHETMLPRLARRVVDILTEEVSAGRPAPEFPERVRRCLETLRLQAACFECNDDQLAGLCGELRTGYGLDATGVDLDTLRAGEPPPLAVRRADLLVTTVFHADAVRSMARALDKPLIVATIDPAFRRGVERLLAKREVFFVVTDPRFERKLRSIFASAAGVERLRVMVTGRDDPSLIPADAPLVVMRSVRERLPDAPVASRASPPARSFSEETVRQLLTFIVDANVRAMLARSDSDDGAREES